MKRIMKKIYNILLAAITLFAFAPVVSAQDPEPDWSINGQIKDEGNEGANPNFPNPLPLKTDNINKLAYNKNVSAPFSDGTYWIKLETFATGSAATIVTSTPADIILVLDSSSSMTYDYSGRVQWISRGVRNYTASNFQNNPDYYYKHTDGYHRVTRVRGNNNVWYLTFTDNANKTWYLNNASNTDEDGLLEAQTATSPTSQNTTCWHGELWESRSITRLEALQAAVSKFIDNIWQNDHDVSASDPSFAGNRIAVVTYDDQAYKLSSSFSWVTANNQYANWFDIGADGVRDNLKTAVNGMGTHNWTRPGLGMRAAINDLLDGNPAAKRPEANLTVVMFTDGVPARQTGTGNTFENDVANQAIYYGYQLKQDYGANLYTVGILNPESTDENVIKGIHFLDLLSSNYPKSYIDAETTNNSAWTVSGNTVSVQNLTGGSANDRDPEGNYSMLDNGDLTTIFDEISQQAGGTANQSLSAATSNVDVISNNFMLPPGTTADNIKDVVKVFTAKLDRIENGEYIFDEEILIDHSDDTYYALDDHGAPTGEPLDVDKKIDIDIVGTNGITVTGFDYSANFCGPIYKTDGTTVDHYQGHKVIIMIPIKMNPDAVGGPNAPTNDPTSGIYVNSTDPEPLVKFDTPTVSLPVNIHFKKTGLKPGESAKFMIERAIIPDRANWTVDDEDLDWKYVSSVFVTQPMDASASNEPMVKVRGMPATTMVDGKQKGYVYRVTEEEWAWSYERDKAPQYTTTDNVQNPFVFSNKPKDNIDVRVRHAESKANNIFKPGESKHIIYIDSKTNTGTGRY